MIDCRVMSRRYLVINLSVFFTPGQVVSNLIVTTQVPKPLSGDFTMQKLSGTWSILQPTGNLTAECAEGRRGKING